MKGDKIVKSDEGTATGESGSEYIRFNEDRHWYKVDGKVFNLMQLSGIYDEVDGALIERPDANQ